METTGSKQILNYLLQNKHLLQQAFRNVMQSDEVWQCKSDRDASNRHLALLIIPELKIFLILKCPAQNVTYFQFWTTSKSTIELWPSGLSLNNPFTFVYPVKCLRCWSTCRDGLEDQGERKVGPKFSNLFLTFVGRSVWSA